MVMKGHGFQIGFFSFAAFLWCGSFSRLAYSFYSGVINTPSTTRTLVDIHRHGSKQFFTRGAWEKKEKKEREFSKACEGIFDTGR